MHRSRLSTLVIDCQTNDAGAAAQFWSQALGLPVKPPAGSDNPAYRELQTPPEDVHVLVQAVTHPSRVHLDIETDDVEAEVRRLEALGATRVTQVKTWWVMESPTGQRFCVVRPQRDGFEQGANVWGEPAGKGRG